MGADHRHWDDRRAGPQCEADGAGLGPFRPAVRIAGDASLGEHADCLTGGEGGGCGIEGVSRIGSAAGDRDETEPAQRPAEDRHTEHPRRRQQAQRPAEPPARQRQQDAVGVARVVGDDDDRSVGEALGGKATATLALDGQPADGRHRDSGNGSEHGVQQGAGASRVPPPVAHWRTMAAWSVVWGDGWCATELKAPYC